MQVYILTIVAWCFNTYLYGKNVYISIMLNMLRSSNVYFFIIKLKVLSPNFLKVTVHYFYILSPYCIKSPPEYHASNYTLISIDQLSPKFCSVVINLYIFIIFLFILSFIRCITFTFKPLSSLLVLLGL